tara:strand:+ start:6918 stop:8768 length:1851 start_codon:yes stop_codon:yes gene_type:complete
MQLKRLAIKEYRNLREMDITFPEMYENPLNSKTQQAKPIRSHALIGQNGMGKSNLMEALIVIFKGIDLGLSIEFDYELEYTIRGHNILIIGDSSKQKLPLVWVDGEKKFLDYLRLNDKPRGEDDKNYTPDLRRGPRLLPSHVFAYYSGRNERIEDLFQDHQHRFIERQEVRAEEVLPEHLLNSFTASESDIAQLEKLSRKRNRILSTDDKLRRLFYCRGGHTQLVLLTCLLSDDPVFKRILDNLNIESLESALFVIKEPYKIQQKRKRGTFTEADIYEGDPRFWYARGNVVTEFLDKLWDVSLAPITQNVRKKVDFRGRTEEQKQINLFVPSKEKLKELADFIGSDAGFFRFAESAYIGDLIDEVRITVKKKDAHGGKVNFTQLSEGELQMLTVLGLMRITSEDHCLFLLDEPDTHLNPIWKLRYFDDIEDVLKPRSESGIQGESQILITTHDPMMIGSLKKEQVHIIRKNGDKTLVEQPDEHPQGMGISGLLKSEMFGLPSTLDRHTLDALQKRNDLLGKSKKEGLSEEEQQELDYLVVRLDDLGFSREYRDPMYQLFIEQMYKVRSKPLNELLSEDELEEQNTAAEQIIEQLVKAQRLDDLSSLTQELAVKLKE